MTPVRPATPTLPRLGQLRRLRRAVLARRRLLAALCAGLAVLSLGRALQGPSPLTEPVVVAATDVPGGAPLTAEALEVVDVPVGEVPAGAAASPEEVAGRTVTAPLRAGEPVTDVRVLAPGLLAGYPGTVAAPVRVADVGVVGLLRVGDRVEVLASDPAGGSAALSLGRAPVVALPRPDDGIPGGATAGHGAGGGLVVLAVPPATAARLAQAAVTRVLSVVLVP